jgi:hypothetical protein
MAANLTTNVPLVSDSLVDPQTGRITEAWLLFLIQLWRRTGGAISSGSGGSVSIADVIGLDTTQSIPLPDLNAAHFSDEVSYAQPLPDLNAAHFADEITFSPISSTDYAQAAFTVTLGTSPATYTATSRQGIHINSGTVSAISYKRSTTTLTLSSTLPQFIELSPGDSLTITYSSVPTVTVLPR